MRIHPHQVGIRARAPLLVGC